MMGNMLDKKSKKMAPTESSLVRESQQTAVDQQSIIDWNIDMEVQLFYAMRGHKPVGVNRHFQMACIHEKFKNSVQKDVTTQQIWDHLDTMYDMAALHESEILPFPNDETEFTLPDEFSKEINERMHNDVGNNSTTKTDDAIKEPTTLSGENKESASTKQQSTKSDRQPAKSSTPATTVSDNDSVSDTGGSSAGAQQKRKRNTRNVQEQQSASNSQTATTLSSTPSSTKRRRN